ncbi:MAG: hypothetical protein IPJ65_40895 [Archangiaceae bacterium]|nr:hypothetical protein [Archangiaceae bacterium]
MPRAVVLLATSPDVFEKWATARPAERGSMKGLTEKVKINERTLIAIGLEGYQLPRSRRVELSADIVIIDSTGRTVLEKASVAGARLFDPKTQTAVLLKPFGALNYGVTDPEGVYTAKITVWDQIRGESSKTETQFTVSR